MNSHLIRRFATTLVAAGLALSSVSCFSGLGYWQQGYTGYPNQQPGYGPQGPGPGYQQQQQPQQQGGFFRRWNTDQAPRYGYNGQQQPYYADPNGTQYPQNGNVQPRPVNPKPKPKTRGESASSLHKRESKPKTTDGGSEPSQPKPKAPTSSELPAGKPVIGKPGFVYSPYAPEKGMVDVLDIPSGTKVECPYTGKHFRVP